MRPITNTSKNFYVTINVLKLLTSLTGLSALSTFGDSESEIGSSSYTCQYKLFIRFKDYSYNNVVQYIIYNNYYKPTLHPECAGDTQGTKEDQGQVGGTT